MRRQRGLFQGPAIEHALEVPKIFKRGNCSYEEIAERKRLRLRPDALFSLNFPNNLFAWMLLVGQYRLRSNAPAGKRSVRIIIGGGVSLRPSSRAERAPDPRRPESRLAAGQTRYARYPN